MTLTVVYNSICLIDNIVRTNCYVITVVILKPYARGTYALQHTHTRVYIHDVYAKLVALVLYTVSYFRETSSELR